MADISTELARILSAIYGEDVRGSIHDAIEKINDVSEKVIDAGTAVTSASSSSTGYYTDSLYVNTDTNDLWRCTGTDAWALIGNLEGAQGETGNGIESIELTSTIGLVDTYTITYTDGSTSTFTIHNGAVPIITVNATADALSSATPTVTVTRTGTTDAPIFSMAFSGLKGQQGIQGIQGETGETGNGIASIAKTSTSGKVDTYTITMTDGSTATFTVTNGEDGHGAGDMLQSAYDPDLDVYNAGGIVDYVAAHAALYSAGANINISSGHVISVTGLATVATSGAYADLTGQPAIPTITDTYSATSSNGMSGKAVASAISGKADTSLLKSTVGWTGKNLNNSKYVTETSNTVTFTANNNHSISVNGTATGGNAQTSDDAENRFVASVTAQVILSGVLSSAPDGLELFPWDYTINSRPYADSSQTTLQTNSVTASRPEISFYMIAGHIYYIRARLAQNKTANNVTIYPMLRDASITDDTYEPYHESVEEVVEQIYADNGVLGAKNLLKNFAPSSYTAQGVTFTKNSDGSITANGTNTGTSNVTCLLGEPDSTALNKYIGKRLKMTGCKGNAFIFIAIRHTDSTPTETYTDTGNGVEFVIPNNIKNIGSSILVGSGKTVNNETVYPMLRLASDPDDTYVPYAMTNKEITEELTAINNGLDDWTSTATVSSSGTVSFSGLNDSYGYKIYYTLPSGDSAYTFSKVTKSGSGTSVTLTFTTDAPSGTVCKLRILK